MKKTAKKKTSKKATKKRSAPAKGRVAAAGKTVKKAGKSMLAKAGLNKSAVKKKVVKKLKSVGVAMARAAMDELMPAQDASQQRAGGGNGVAKRAGTDTATKKPRRGSPR